MDFERAVTVSVGLQGAFGLGLHVEVADSEEGALLLSFAQGHHKVSGDVIHIMSDTGLTFDMVTFLADVVKCLVQRKPVC